MTTLLDAEGLEHTASGSALRELAARLRRRLASEQDDVGVLVRAELRIVPVEALEWLHTQKNRSHYYWASRDGAFEMAGIGEADVLVPESRVDLPGLFAHMRHRLSIEWPCLRYYGGFRFRPEQDAAGRWRNFKAYRFIAPQVEVFRCGEKYWLACTLRKDMPDANETTLQAIETLAAALIDSSSPPTYTLPPMTGRIDLPDRERWNSLVDRALEAFAGREMDKVVLARETEFQFDTEEPLDAVGILRRLVRRASPCYAFCFHPKPDRAFLGASPERLFYRNNVYLQSEALAGTCRRG